MDTLRNQVDKMHVPHRSRLGKHSCMFVSLCSSLFLMEA